MKNIIKNIEQSYGDLSNPNFGFVEKVVKKQPYKEFVEKLKSNFSVKEDTDLNDDVSFVFILSKDDSTWDLRLSMVGRYAFLREFTISPTQSLGKNDNHKDSICSLLKKDNFELLTESTLVEKISIDLFNAENGRVSLFRCLFSDH